MKLWVKILVGLLAGVVVGSILGEKAKNLTFIGTIFMDLVKMLIVPLVFSSMVVGISSIHDPKKLGRVGSKALLFYLITTAIGIVFGLFFAYTIQPGAGLNFPLEADAQVGNLPSLASMLLDIIPSNPIGALAQGQDKILQIIIFALFLGISIGVAGEKGRPLLKFFESLSEVMYCLTNIIMELAPFGVFAIMAAVTGDTGVDGLFSLGKFLTSVWSACILQVGVVFVIIIAVFARLNPKQFFRGMRDPMLFAFSTTSSSGTLPVSLRCVQENLGVSRNIATFVLPLGATINMNGTAIFQAVGAVFVAQAYGIDLSWDALITIVVTATFSAIGAAGIPGTGWLLLSMVLESAGLPLGRALGMLYGVDRVREMVTCVVNILGDAVVAVYVAKSEGELDIYQYNHGHLVEADESDI